MKTRPSHKFAVSVAAIAVVFTFGAIDTAYAAERKSIRWATSQVGSYGYMVAASMTRIVEAALGGEYTVTVQPYSSPTVSMKAMMDGNGEIS